MIGIVGAPNKGKSTLFSALTMHEVQIANYPFTTIKPNMGVAYAIRECAEKKIGAKCKPRNSLCHNGMRMIPVNMVDVAGLVEDAHEGKGMGNQFLNDMAAADALMLVVDISGTTDPAGNPCASCDPYEDIVMVKNELAEWIAGILGSHMDKLSKVEDGAAALASIFSGLKIDRDTVEGIASKCSLSTNRINWDEYGVWAFSTALLDATKPVMVIANKADIGDPSAAIKSLREKSKDEVVPCSAAIELALRKAAQKGIIDYFQGDKAFNIIAKDITEEQRRALEYMKKFIGGMGDNVQYAINKIVFDIGKNIVVYPVEDENKFTDHYGNVLPDAVLMKQGSTALDLANSIHTDIGKNMLYAVDAITKMRLSKSYVLKDGDIIKIVSAAK